MLTLSEDMKPGADNLSVTANDVWRTRAWLYALAVLLVFSALLFAATLKGEPVWDDFDILRGDAIGAHYGWPGAFTQPFNFGYYRPFVSLSFQLDRSLFGTVPLFYHQTNVLIHVVTVLFVALTFTRLFKSRWGGLAAGLLFGVQPMQASTVAWIGGRTDSLCTLFVSVFMYLLVRAFEGTKRRGWWLLGSALALFSAMMCKEQSALGFLLVPAAYVLFTEKSERCFRQWTLTLAPFFFACVAFASLWIVSPFGKLPAEPHTLLEQLALGGRGIWHYFLLMFAPSPSVLHTFTFENSRAAGWWPIVAGFGVLVGSSVALFVLWRRRSPVFLVACAVALFVLPITNIVPVPSLSVGPYRIGIAGPALAMLFALIALRLRERSRTLAYIAVGGLVLWQGALTVWATQQWAKEEVFFTTVTRYDPAFYVARVNIAASYDTFEDDAIGHVSTFLDWVYQSDEWQDKETALALWENDPSIEQRIKDNAGTRVPTFAFMANAFLNLGLSQLRDGRNDGIESLETAVALNPLDANIHTGLGEAYLKIDQDEKSEKSFLKAITIQEYSAAARLGYANLLTKQKRFEEAEQQLRTTIKWTPKHGVPYLKLAMLLAKTGRRADAVTALDLAVTNGALTRHNADELIATMPEPSVTDDSSGHPEN